MMQRHLFQGIKAGKERANADIYANLNTKDVFQNAL